MQIFDFALFNKKIFFVMIHELGRIRNVFYGGVCMVKLMIIISGLFYDAYLKEVIAVLEKDEEFRNKMANVNFEDVKVATFSKELNTVAKHVRDELDTLKRKEIDRIRKLLKGKGTTLKNRLCSIYYFLA